MNQSLLEIVSDMLACELSLQPRWAEDRTELRIMSKKHRGVICSIGLDGAVSFDKARIKSFSEMNTVNQVRKTVANAQEKQKLLSKAEPIVLRDNGYNSEYLILASFHDICLLQNNCTFGGRHYYVWKRDTTLEYRDIIYSYEDAKKAFGRQAGLINDALAFPEVHAIYQAIRYYKENRPEREPLDLNTMEEVQRHILRVCPAVDTGSDMAFPSYQWGEAVDSDGDGEDDYDDDDGELQF